MYWPRRWWQKSGGTRACGLPRCGGPRRERLAERPGAYQVPTYATDMLAMLAQLKPTTLDWVGTSMGGLIGMGVCMPWPLQLSLGQPW